MYSRFSIHSNGSLKLGSQMSRLRQATRQMWIQSSMVSLVLDPLAEQAPRQQTIHASNLSIGIGIAKL